MLDVEVAGPLLDGATAAAAEESHLDAGALQHPNRQAITHIEALHHASFLVVVEPAIGEHPIHITHQQENLLEAFGDQ